LSYGRWTGTTDDLVRSIRALDDAVPDGDRTVFRSSVSLPPGVEHEYASVAELEVGLKTLELGAVDHVRAWKQRWDPDKNERWHASVGFGSGVAVSVEGTDQRWVDGTTVALDREARKNKRRPNNPDFWAGLLTSGSSFLALFFASVTYGLNDPLSLWIAIPVLLGLAAGLLVGFALWVDSVIPRFAIVGDDKTRLSRRAFSSMPGVAKTLALIAATAIVSALATRWLSGE
jgi:hypothetical protein